MCFINIKHCEKTRLYIQLIDGARGIQGHDMGGKQIKQSM